MNLRIPWSRSYNLGTVATAPVSKHFKSIQPTARYSRAMYTTPEALTRQKTEPVTCHAISQMKGLPNKRYCKSMIFDPFSTHVFDQGSLLPQRSDSLCPPRSINSLVASSLHQTAAQRPRRVVIISLETRRHRYLVIGV